MNVSHPRYEGAVLGAAALFHAIGLFGWALPALRPWTAPAAPAVLLSFGLLVIAPSLRERGRAFIAWSVAAYGITFALEAVGVATSLIFGPYAYGAALGEKIFEVPPIIGFNWLIVVVGASGAAHLVGLRGMAAALATGLAAALFDWLLEPAALALGYWAWFVDPIPFQNYAAWFAIATAFALALESLPDGAARRNPLRRSGYARAEFLAASYLAIQGAYFIGVRSVEAWT